MSSPLKNEDAVVAAVREYLTAGVSGHDLPSAMASLSAETSALSLDNLDEWETKIRNELWAIERAPPAGRQRFWKKPSDFVSLLDLCSGDGFRRERILRSLQGGAPNGFFFALTLRRLNDWAPQVRAAAREHLPQLAERSDPESVVDALWNSLAHFRSWGRMQEADREILLHLVSVGKIALALKSRIIQAATGPATQVFSQAGRSPILDDWLEEFATNAVQPSVRAKACCSLLDGRMVWVVGRKWRWTDVKWCKGRFEPLLEERALSDRAQVVPLIAKAMVDKSPLVRRVAAEFLIKEPSSIGADASKFAEHLASDSCAYVAERGRFALGMLAVHK